MSQSILQIPMAAPLSGLSMVSDVNSALASLASLCSGPSEPSAISLGLSSAAGLLWHDTTNNLLKLRNQADSAWILLGSIDETNGVFVPVSSPSSAAISGATTLARGHDGQMLVASAALTVTLPASTSLSASWMTSVFAKSGMVSLVLANSSDSLNGVVGGSLVLPRGYLAQLVTDAAGNYTVLQLPAGLGLSAMASAATVDLGTAATRIVSITGTTAITSLGSTASAGAIYTLLFSSSLTLTQNAASLILPGGGNIITLAGDVGQFLCLGNGNWQCVSYQVSVAKSTVSATVPVRQTALVGVADSSGRAAFITTGSGLAPALLASASPLVMAFSAGFSTVGAVDNVERITADNAAFFGTLPASGLSYLYASRVTAGSVSGGATLAPPQYAATYNQAAQAKLDLNNSNLDDFGNAWANYGVTFSNTSPAIAGTYYGVFNGSSTYMRSTAFNSISQFGNGGWSLRTWVRPTNLPGTNINVGIMHAYNGVYGAYLAISNTSGTVKFGMGLSSTGTSWDIANLATGSVTPVVNTWYFVEITYDPIAGKYYQYVNGVLDATVTSSARISAIAGIQLGTQNTTAYYFSGNMQGFEFLPYCQHPAGTTYAVPATLANITAAGYASDWFDAVNMVMKSPCAASSVSGNNPAFSVGNKLYVGEAQAGASSISSVVNYAFQGQYDSGLFAVSAATNYSKNHNTGTIAINVAITYSIDASGQSETVATKFVYNAGNYYGWEATPGLMSRLSFGIITLSNGPQNTCPSGYYRIRTKRSF